VRNLTPDMAAEFSSEYTSPALMADLFFDSGTVRMWSGLGTLTWGDNTYSGGGNLIGLSPIEETQDLVANGIVVSLSGISSQNLALSLTENTRRRPFRLYLGVVTTRQYIETEDGTGLVELEDGSGYIRLENSLVDSPYRIFSGLMDVIESTNNGQTHTLRLSVENILLVGQRPRLLRYTDIDQKKTYPTDRGLELINQLQDKEVVW
jgi:hypothetical protein